MTLAPPSSADEMGESFLAPEVYSADAIAKIARSLPLLERTYARIRFSILRSKLLSVMDLLLPDTGRLLDVGCGFGLFACYFSQMHPSRRVVGVDPNERRIEMARRVAADIGLHGARFIAGDARSVPLEGTFDAAYVLDVMHHIPREGQEGLLSRLHRLLVPGGRLVIKDITTVPASGLWFTTALDRLVVGPNEPLAYRHHSEWGRLLRALGFHVRIVRVEDILPYPHIVIAATKRT